MAQSDPIKGDAAPEKKPETDEPIVNPEEHREEITRSLSTGAAGDPETSSVRELQDRAEAALGDPGNTPSAGPELDPGYGPEYEIVADAWSPRKRLLFIVGASAGCWAVILAPFLL